MKDNSRLRISQVSHITQIGVGSTDCWEMIFVISGELTLTLENKVYKLTQQTAAFLAPDKFRFINDNGKSEYIYLSFIPEGELISELSGSVISLSENEVKLLNAFNNISEYEDAIERSKAYSMFEIFLLYCFENEDELLPINNKNAELFTKAADILRETITAPIAVSDLAEQLDISLSNLKRIFARFAGIGAHEYLNFFRIIKAKELLVSGESVTRTAELSGFANQAYFSAAFKRITGYTPREYAAANLGTDASKPTQTTQKPKDLPSYLL